MRGSPFSFKQVSKNSKPAGKRNLSHHHNHPAGLIASQPAWQRNLAQQTVVQRDRGQKELSRRKLSKYTAKAPCNHLSRAASLSRCPRGRVVVRVSIVKESLQPVLEIHLRLRSQLRALILRSGRSWRERREGASTCSFGRVSAPYISLRLISRPRLRRKSFGESVSPRKRGDQHGGAASTSRSGQTSRPLRF